MDDIHEYAQEIVLRHQLLRESQEKLGLVLAGSRAVGYEVDSSDFDFLAVCDRETSEYIAKLAGKRCGRKGIDIPVDRDAIKKRYGIELDVAVYDRERVKQAFNDYRDVVIWIWTNAKVLADPTGCVESLQGGFDGYPRQVLERKLKRHFLTDFHLSVYGITYRYESQNVFSVAYALANKVAAFCRLCCLLDGKPFPYEKWLLRACEETVTGEKLWPLLERAVSSITRLDGDLVKNAALLKEAVHLLDTEACGIMEKALVSWGIEAEWIENAYEYVEDVLFEDL